MIANPDYVVPQGIGPCLQARKARLFPELGRKWLALCPKAWVEFQGIRNTYQPRCPRRVSNSPLRVTKPVLFRTKLQGRI